MGAAPEAEKSAGLPRFDIVTALSSTALAAAGREEVLSSGCTSSLLPCVVPGTIISRCSPRAITLLRFADL